MNQESQPVKSNNGIYMQADKQTNRHSQAG